MEVCISTDEMYPVFVFADYPSAVIAKVSKKQYERWSKATAEFEKAQREMHKVYNRVAVKDR